MRCTVWAQNLCFSCNERVFLQEARRCETEQDTNGKTVTWLLLQTVHHRIQHFTVDSILEGQRGKKEKWGKKHWKGEHLDLPEIPPTATTQDAHRPNTLHRDALLVLSRNGVEVCSLRYNGVSVSLTQQLCSSGTCTESGGNWDHLFPHMKMLRAWPLGEQTQPWGSCLLQMLGANAPLQIRAMLCRQGSIREG